MKIVPKRKWRHPLALEREYSKYLVKFVDDNMEVAKQFTPEIADWIRTYAFRFDSTITELEILLDKMHAAMKKPEQMTDIVTSMAIRIDRYNRSEWQAITKSVLGMPIRDIPIRKIHQDAEADDNLRELWVSENLDLIKSIDQQTMQRIKQSMQEKIVGAVNRRELTRELTGEIERIAELERNRAVLIARDQVGKLNGRLMQYRQQHAGITEYIWVTSGDRRVRPSHAVLEGQKFTWGPEHPAPEGSPGIPVRCRCVADPIIDLDKIVTEPVPGSYLTVKEKKTVQTAAENSIINTTKHSESFEKLMTYTTQYKVKNNPVSKLTKPLNPLEIINRISGPDKTKGSCVSVALSYIGNKYGLDVLDFRGGSSQRFFSKDMTINLIANLAGVISKKKFVEKELDGAASFIQQLDGGKEYFLSVGRHAAIIRKIGKLIQYLELQSDDLNGWKNMANDVGDIRWVLWSRFCCRKTVGGDVLVIDIDSLKDNVEFREILGYLNTAAEKQKKGEGGYAR